MTALDALLASFPRTTLVLGKGGVGKTTCAAGLAAHFARRGERTLLVSTDPAAALAGVLDAPVSAQATPIPDQPRLDARQLSARVLREDFLNRWRETIAEIVDRGTYLDRSDVDGLVDAALPGGDEIFALLALADLLSDPSPEHARIVVDTAPTGHTLRLLALPETFRALVAMLEAMQSKHRFMVRALTRRYRRDRADDFLDEMRSKVDALRERLADDDSVAGVVVTRDEPLVIAETRRYVDRLRALRVRIAAIIVNGAQGNVNVVENDPSIPEYRLPLVAPPPLGVPALTAALESIATIATRSPAMRPESRSETAPATPGNDVATIPRPLTIVAGKGGVGKSTVACALAVAAADEDSQTLLVSTDPAPSIADALGKSDAPWAENDIEATIDEVPGLVVRQLNATAAFARLRETYQERIDALFETLLARGVDIAHDRAIVRDLLALAPPGVDELFALSTLGDAVVGGRFDRIIVDPAPTGHLLRLLEMPAIALDWSHRLMRLMLKYREITGLGETARELLDFAKRTRTLQAIFVDHSRCGLVLVSLDEPLARAETERLAAAVRRLGIDVGAVVWNRASGPTEPLPATSAGRQVFAGEVQPPPVGARALRQWSRTWRTAPTDF